MNTQMPAEVFPPGEYIRDELEARNWTQQDLAKILNRPLPTINLIISGKRSVTPETAKGLAAAFGTSAELWLSLENAFQLGKLKNDESDVTVRARLYDVAPVGEMIKRGWIEETNNLAVLESNLARFFETKSLDQIESFAVAARKKDYSQTTPAQRAWLFRARGLARNLKVKEFDSEKLKALLNELRTATMEPDNIKQVSRVLADIGIRLVVVEPLQKTAIDGAAFWLDKNSPVVVLSLRFDRIDAFWFTLIHELIHILYNDGDVIDINLVSDARGTQTNEITDEIETRTNAEAAELLVPQEKLRSFISRIKPLYSKHKIIQFARAQNVHPGIVVGQLQRRKEISYAHSREMLVPVRQYLMGSTMTDGYGQVTGAF